MSKTNSIFLLTQLIITICVYFLFFRTNKTPPIIKLLLIVSYITVPIAVAITGIGSAVYLSDLLLPILIIYFIKKPELATKAIKNKWVFLLSTILIFLPFMTGAILTIMDRFDIFSLNTIIWFYRNLTFIVVFAIGISTKVNADESLDFLKMNVGLGVVLSLLGLVNYFGPINMSVFETIHQGGTLLESSLGRIGYGFLGLFRGSVGQWFAVVIILAIGGSVCMKRWYKICTLILLISGTGVILLSNSRAGFLGLLTGLAVLGLAMARERKALVIVAAIIVIILWFHFQPGLFEGRYSFVSPRRLRSLVSEGDVGRNEAWKTSYEYLSSNPQGLLLGVGPNNSSKVYEITGLYGAHNEYLSSVFTAGILEFFLIVAFIILMISKLLKDARQTDGSSRFIIWSVIAIILANLVIGITQAHLLHDYATYTLGFYLYLLYGVFIGAQLHNDNRLRNIETL